MQARVGYPPSSEPNGSVITASGGARSAVWSRIRATVLGNAVAVAVNAGTATSECLLAAAGPVHADLTAAAAAMVRPARLIEPDEATMPGHGGRLRPLEVLARRGRFLPFTTAQSQLSWAKESHGECHGLHGEGRALNNLGVALREMRRFEVAISAHQDAAAISARPATGTARAGR